MGTNKLVEKALKVRSLRTDSYVTQEEDLGLAVAYLKGIVSLAQVRGAKEAKSSTQVYIFACKTIKQAVAAGKLELIEK